MKIVVIGWRPWAVVRRFRSLILNAKRLGYQVWGFTSRIKPEGLTLAAFQELGVEAYPENRFASTIDKLDPDVIFGINLTGRHSIEIKAQDWVTKRGKVGLIQHHSVCQPTERLFRPQWTRTYLINANELQFELQVEKAGWPPNQMYILGAPDFDSLVGQEFDVPDIRRKLGVGLDQKLIGVFPTTSVWPIDKIVKLLKTGKEYNWRVVVHPHPSERWLQNSDSAAGWGPMDSSTNWPKLSKLGAYCIVEHAPGTIMGVEFHKHSTAGLIAAADCLISAGRDSASEAYALGKQCRLFYPPVPHILEHPEIEGLNEFLDPEFESLDSVEKIEYTLAQGSNEVIQDPDFLRKWFYKLDGLWWHRALALAEELINDSS